MHEQAAQWGRQAGQRQAEYGQAGHAGVGEAGPGLEAQHRIAALANAPRRRCLAGIGSTWLLRGLPLVGIMPALASATPLLPQRQSLPDGTWFAYGPDTQFTVVHTDTAREIWLHQGRLQVCSGRAALPWIVCAGQSRLWPLAADYVVQRTPAELALQVGAGSVALQSPALATTVVAGQSRRWRESGADAAVAGLRGDTSAAQWALAGLPLSARL